MNENNTLQNFTIKKMSEIIISFMYQNFNGVTFKITQKLLCFILYTT